MSDIDSDINAIRAALDAALAEMLAAFDGVTAEEFVRPGGAGASASAPSMADVVWRAGLHEDWLRRTVDQALRGVELPAFLDRPRPAIAASPEYLATWLDQCRRPTLALLRRLAEDDLDRAYTPPEESTSEREPGTPRTWLSRVAMQMREHATAVRLLRASQAASTEEKG